MARWMCTQMDEEWVDRWLNEQEGEGEWVRRPQMRFENALFCIIKQGSQIDTCTGVHFHPVLFLLKHLVEIAVGYVYVCVCLCAWFGTCACQWFINVCQFFLNVSPTPPPPTPHPYPSKTNDKSRHLNKSVSHSNHSDFS